MEARKKKVKKCGKVERIETIIRKFVTLIYILLYFILFYFILFIQHNL